MKVDEEKMTRMIANLLRKAERNDGPEAENAGRKAQSLMAKHSLQVVLDPRESPDYEEYKMQVFPAERAWIIALAGALAAEHACNAYFQPTNQGFGFLVITGSADRVLALQQAYNRYFDQISMVAGQRDTPSFRLGAAKAVHDMFEQQREHERKIRRAREDDGDETTALALRRRYVHVAPINERSTGPARAPDSRVPDNRDPDSDDPLPADDPTPPAYMESKQVVPPISPRFYQLGYAMMSRALGVAGPVVSWWRRRRQ